MPAKGVETLQVTNLARVKVPNLDTLRYSRTHGLVDQNPSERILIGFDLTGFLTLFVCGGIAT